jgi:predicted RNA polymerase sigma factor
MNKIKIKRKKEREEEHQALKKGMQESRKAQRNRDNKYNRDTCTLMFITAPLTIAKLWK